MRNACKIVRKADHLEDLGADERIIFKSILKKEGAETVTGFSLLKIGSGDRIL
jgi:hypothetical protein